VDPCLEPVAGSLGPVAGSRAVVDPLGLVGPVDLVEGDYAL